MSLVRNAFSVVIPIYNSSNYIKRTLESIVMSSENYEIEIILIDDKSNDIILTKNIIEKFANVVLIEKDIKSNAAHSRNMGYEFSKYEKVFFLDSDDCFTKKYISHRNELMDSLEYGIFFGGYTTVTKDKHSVLIRPHYHGGDMRDYIFIQKGDFRTSTVSVDKRFHKGTLFDPKMRKHQDWGFGIRCFDASEKIFFDESTYIQIHEGRHDQMSASMNIPASSYFVANYLKKDRHLLNFVDVHIIRAICNKDREALNYFFSILERIEIQGKKKYFFMILKFLSNKHFIWATSLLFIIIRHLKKYSAKMRS